MGRKCQEEPPCRGGVLGDSQTPLGRASRLVLTTWASGIKGDSPFRLQPLKFADPADLWACGTCLLRARQGVTCWEITEATLVEASCFLALPQAGSVRTRVGLALKQRRNLRPSRAWGEALWLQKCSQRNSDSRPKGNQSFSHPRGNLSYNTGIW